MAVPSPVGDVKNMCDQLVLSCLYIDIQIKCIVSNFFRDINRTFLPNYECVQYLPVLVFSFHGAWGLLVLDI